MAEELLISADTDRQSRYQQLLAQLQALTAGETNVVANLANIAAALRQTFGFFWVGFYLVEGEQLVLGPFQGDIACTRIGLGRGVCGTAWQTGAAQWVRDVDAFPGHIVCSSAARSEVVVPLIRDRVVIGVLDVDSDHLDDFEQSDLDGLNAICAWLVTLL